MSNIKTRLFLILTITLMLAVGISAISATDSSEISTNMTQQASVDVDVVSDNIKTTYDVDDTSVSSSSSAQSDDLAATKSNKRNSLRDNSYVINQNNYDTYFNSEGYLNSISEGDVLIFSGTISGKTMYIDVPVNITSASDETELINCSIKVLMDAEDTNITNLVFTDNDYTEAVIYIDEAYYVSIQNVRINQENTNGKTKGIHAYGADGLTIEGCVINVKGPDVDSPWDSSDGINYIQTINTAGLFVDSCYDSFIINNIINTERITYGTDTYATIKSLVITNSEYVVADSNIISTDSTVYAYCFEFTSSSNCEVTNNVLSAVSDYYTCGIESKGLGEGNLIENNNITLISMNRNNVSDTRTISYGIFISDTSKGQTITHNNIISQAGAIYLFEFFQVHNCNVSYNNLTGDGEKSLGIGAYNSSNNYFAYNNINVTGTNSTGNVGVDSIPVETTGLVLLSQSNNNTFDNNIVDVDSPSTPYIAHIISGSNNSVINNQLKNKGTLVNATVYDDDGSTIISNNSNTDTTLKNVTIEGINVTDYTLTDVIIEVIVLDEDHEPVNEGTVEFTDADGNTLGSSNVTEGIASITTVFNKEYDDVVTVTYSETDSYAASEGSINVTINKKNTNIVIDDMGEVKLGDTVTINVTLSSGDNLLSGEAVTLTVNNQTLTNTTENGIAKFDVTFNDAGEYKIVASYEGSTAYNGTKTNVTLSVEALDTVVEATVTSPVKYGADVTINGTIKDENGKLLEGIDAAIYVNGVEVTNVTTGDDGTFTYEFTADTIGLNNVTVESVATTNYNSNSYSTNFQVQSTITMTANPINASINDTITISVNVVDQNNIPLNEGIIVFTDNNDNVLGNASVVNGNAAITYKFEKYYDGTVTTTFKGTDAYDTTSIEIPVTINRFDVTLQALGMQSVVINQNTSVMVLARRGDYPVSLSLTLTLPNGLVINSTSTGIISQFNYNISNAGAYELTVMYAGSDIYNPANISFEQIINPSNLHMDLFGLSNYIIYFDEGTNITGILVDTPTGNPVNDIDVIIYINDIEVGRTKTNSTGGFLYQYDGSDNLIYDNNVTVKTVPTNNYPTQYVKETFLLVKELNTTMNASDVKGVVDQNVTITVDLNDQRGKPVIDGNVIFTDSEGNILGNTTVENGVATLIYKFDKLYNGIINASYVENYKYNSTSVIITANIDKANSSIAISSPETMKVNEEAIVNVTVITGDRISNGETVTLKISDDVTLTNTTVNGVASFTVSYVEVGTYTLNASYGGNEAYNEASEVVPISISMFTVNISGNNVTGLVNKQVTIAVTVIDENGNNVNEGKVIFTDAEGNVIGESTVVDGLASINKTFNTEYNGIVTVNYTQSDIYSTASTNISLVISKQNLSIAINDIGTVKAGDTVIINVTLSSGDELLSDETVTLTVNNQTLTNTTEEGVAKFTFKFDAGEYEITASYDGSTVYNGDEANVTLSVEALNTIVEAQVSSPVKIGADVTISGTVKDENGELLEGIDAAIYVNGVRVANVTTDANGTFTYDYTTDTLGLNNVTVESVATTNYNSNNYNTTFEVESLNVTITGADVTGTTLSNVTIIVSVVDENSEAVNGGTIVFTDADDNVLGSAEVVEGSATLTTVFDKEYDGIVTVSYAENGIYSAGEGSVNVAISKITTNITINPIETVVGKEITISVSVTDANGEAVNGGTIELKDADDNTIITMNVTEGTATTQISFNESYDNIIYVIYSGTDSYNKSEATSSLLVNKLNSTIIINDIGTVKAGDTITIEVTLSNGEDLISGETVTLTVNNQTLTNTTEEGVAKFDVEFNDAGEYEIVVSYEGSAVYNGDEANVTLSVGALNTTIVAVVTNPVKIGSNVTISGIIEDENGELLEGIEVSIYVNDVRVANVTTDANGTFTYDYTTDTLGLNNVTVESVATTNYNSNSYNTTFEVESLNVTITGADVNGTALNDVVILVSVVDENGEAVNGGTVVFTDADDNVLGSAEVVEGSANITTVFNKEYDGVVTVSYAENGIYSAGEGSVNVAISKVGTDFKIIDVDTVKIGENVIINVVLTDENNTLLSGKDVTITVNNQTLTNTTEEGVAKFTLNFTDAGEYEIVASYAGDDAYEGSNSNITVTVEALNTIIEANATGVVKYGANVTINGIIKDENDELLEGISAAIYVNGVAVINVTTDENGAFTYDYTADTLGLNNVTVESVATNNYNSNNYSTTFAVESLNVTITGVDVTGTTLSNVTIVVSVVDENGEAVNGGTVVFTDANGNVLGSTELVDGSASITTVFNKIYDDVVTVSYAESGIYSAGEGSVNVTISKIASTVTIDPVEGVIGEVTTIVANVVDANGNPVNGGRVVFKYNGKTLKDADGNVVQANVVNGVATVDFVVPDSWRKSGNLSAKYGGTSAVDSTDSNMVTPTVSLRNVTITVAPQANTAEAGDSVIYVVVVSDAKTGTLINGVVVVKMAGVTIGQVEVVNGIGMFNYTVPTSRRAGDYNMSFVFSNSTYNRAEYDNASLTVKLSQVRLEAPAVVVRGNETGVVKAKVLYTNTGEVVNTPISVAIKVNGKTVDSSRYSNGNIEFELPASYKDGSTITIAVGATYRTAALRKEIQYIKIN